MGEEGGMPGRGGEIYAFFLGNPQGINMLANLMRRLEDFIKVYVKYMR